MISQIASKYINEKEKPGNTGFINPEFEKKLKAVGWQAGWAWCAAFLEAVIWEAYPNRINEVKGLFVPSAVNTFKNLKNAGYHFSMTPSVDSLVFWQHIKNGVAEWTGHTGIVSEVIDPVTFKSIEGNTNNTGSREGDGVYRKTRKVNPNVTDGLKVIGFITI